MSLAIGIPTYNRKRIVELHARSLCAAPMCDEASILVVDDASTQYGVDFLRSLYPVGTVVERRPENSGGADFATQDVLRRLTQTGAQHLLLLDSDMIVASDFAMELEALIADTDGFLSLFNSATHKVIGEAGPFLLKSSAGSAATIWRRDLALEVLENVPPGFNWDWRVSAYLLGSGRRICVTRQSLAQHLGFNEGFNSSSTFGDIGLGFAEGGSVNAYLMIEQLVLDAQARMQTLLDANDALKRRLRLIEAVTGVWLIRAIGKRFGSLRKPR